MNRQTKEAILEKIKAYKRIIIFRHLRPDGDAVGSTKGMQAMLKASFPDKEIYLQNCDFSAYMAFLGSEDGMLEDEEYENALGIVLDTATSDRISNPKYKLCKELIKIDHHIPVENYADLEWVEEERSSCCEMVAAFFETFRDDLQMNREAATCIYAGMVTDSGRFRFRSVCGDTLRLGGMLLDYGVDLDTLYAHLYMKEFHTVKFHAYVLGNLQMTENGVVHIYIPKRVQEQYKLSAEEASACVSYMDSIKDSLIWLAFIEGADGTIRVRLRSRFVTVSELANRYGGGGHACASGANVANKNEMFLLIRDADALLQEYKQENTGWL